MHLSVVCVCQKLGKEIQVLLVFQNIMAEEGWDRFDETIHLSIFLSIKCRGCQMLDSKKHTYHGKQFADELVVAVSKQISEDVVWNNQEIA